MRYALRESVDIILGNGVIRRAMVSKLTSTGNDQEPFIYECIDLEDQLTRYTVRQTAMRKVV